jgi:hypothetical protein
MIVKKCTSVINVPYNWVLMRPPTLLLLFTYVAAACARNSVSSIKWKNTDFVGVATADVHLPVVEGDLLMLSKGVPNGAAAAWLAHPHVLSNGFSLSFSFRALVSQSMDGFAVVFQSDPAQSSALGKPGENLGYAGLKSSVAVGAFCFHSSLRLQPLIPFAMFDFYYFIIHIY